MSCLEEFLLVTLIGVGSSNFLYGFSYGLGYVVPSSRRVSTSYHSDTCQDTGLLKNSADQNEPVPVLTITTSGQNDNSSKFDFSKYEICISDKTRVNQFVFGARATDADVGSQW